VLSINPFSQPLLHPHAASMLLGHCEFSSMLQRVVPVAVQPPCAAPAEAARLAALLPSRGGMSKPLDPLGTVELAVKLSALHSALRRASLAPTPPLPRFVDETELLDVSAVIHLVSLQLADASLALEGQDHPTFNAH
jgi:hypothetical protein